MTLEFQARVKRASKGKCCSKSSLNHIYIKIESLSSVQTQSYSLLVADGSSLGDFQDSSCPGNPLVYLYYPVICQSSASCALIGCHFNCCLEVEESLIPRSCVSCRLQLFHILSSSCWMSLILYGCVEADMKATLATVSPQLKHFRL